jgi:hypothetical protein
MSSNKFYHMSNNKLYNNKFYHMSKFDLILKMSNIVNSGYGVFTNNFIPKDMEIDIYYGEYTESLLGGEYFFRIDNDGGINAIDIPRCYMAMLNDASYRPNSNRQKRKFIDHNYVNNCYFKVDLINKIVNICSLVDIEKGSELFISYGSDYWNT